MTLEEADAALAAGPHAPLSDLRALVTGALAALPADAWWVPGPRERAGAVLRGLPAERLAAIDAGARPYRIAPQLGARRAGVAVGLASGGASVLVHLGAATAADGAFAEALALAVAREAPVVFLVAFDALAGDAPLLPIPSPVPLARAAGARVIEVDGRDPSAVQKAVAKALASRSPTLVLASVGAAAES